MIRWSIVLFIIALIAAVFGFGELAATAAWLAKWLFVALLIGAIVAAAGERRAGR
jgi:uncharacterized membrane protein YtjA (UPF0391 family)